jgi:hypothetical protein
VKFEWAEIPIIVQEWKTTLDTEGGDPTINNLADRKSLCPKLAIIYCALDRISTAKHRVDFEI